jgi:hypothetical protein
MTFSLRGPSALLNVSPDSDHANADRLANEAMNEGASPSFY